MLGDMFFWLVGLMGKAINIVFGFSTYTDGVSNFTENAVYSAPLYLNGSRVSNTTDSWEGSGRGTWSVWLRDLYLESIGNSGNRLYEIEDLLGNNRIDISQISTYHRLVLKSNGVTTTISNVDIPLNTFVDIEVRFSGADATKTAEIFVNGVSEGSDVIDISLGWPFQRYAVGGSSLSGNEYTGLYGSFEIEPLGFWELVRNQDQGLKVISNTGFVATIEEGIAGETQIKADGTSSTAYTWDKSALTVLPKEGPSFFNLTNTLQLSAPVVNIDFSAEWVLIVRDIIVKSDAVDDCQIFQWNDILGRTLTFVYDQTNRRFRCTVFDGTSNKTVNVGSLGTPVDYDTNYSVIIRSVGGAIGARPYEMEVVGYTGTNKDTDTLNFTPYTAANTSFLVIGGVGKKFSGYVGDVSWVKPDGTKFFDSWPLNNRIQKSDDLNFGKIVGLDRKSVLAPTVDNTHMFPYLGASQSLIGDTLEGGGGILAYNSAFILSNYTPITFESFNPEYTQNAYTGATDTVITLGDSNTDADAFGGQTQWPELLAAYCATWLPGVTVNNIALSGLSLYGTAPELYDRVSPNGYTPAVPIGARIISDLAHNIEEAISLGATIVINSAATATVTQGWTDGPYLAFEDIQIHKANNDLCIANGVKYIADTPMVWENAGEPYVSWNATAKIMRAQYLNELTKLGIDYIDQHGIMSHETGYVDSSFMRDFNHYNQAGQNYKFQNVIRPELDRIFNMR